MIDLIKRLCYQLSFFLRSPRIIQMESVECGSAALCILLRRYKKYATLEELRFSCGVSRDGVSSYNIVEAAKKYGFAAQGYEADFEELSFFPTPSILFWEQNHFVVLERILGKHVYINDPATGPRVISSREAKESYSGLVLCFEPTKEFIPGVAPPTLWGRIKARYKPVKTVLYCLLTMEFLTVLFSLTIPAFYQVFIDRFLQEGMPSWKGTFVSLLLGVVLISGAIAWVQGRMLNFIQTKFSIDFASEFFWHLLSLPSRFFSQRFGGEVLQRFKLNSRITSMVTQDLVLSGINLSFVLIYLAIIFHYSVAIGLLGLFAAGFNVAILIYISSQRTSQYALLQQCNARALGLSLDALENIEALKGVGEESFFFSRIGDAYAKSINASIKIERKDIWLSNLSGISQSLTTVGLLGLGTYEVMMGHFTIGMLISLQILLSNFLAPLAGIVSFSSEAQSIGTDLMRLDDVLKNPIDPMLEGRPDPSAGESPLKGRVEYSSVTFGYNPTEKPLVTDFSLVAEEGAMIGIVGEVGSGKSTLAKLGAGLYIPWKGRVLFDGKPIKEVSRELFSHSVAFVDQEISLFAGTVRENVSLWNKEVSLDQIQKACMRAHIHDEILTFPGGYEAELQEEALNLSAGQRQRLEIARALLFEPKVLFLDEAMNTLDSEVEEKILRSLREMGTTTFLISHRLSAVRNADQIIVVQNGKITEKGTHQELSSNRKYYSSQLTKELVSD